MNDKSFQLNMYGVLFCGNIFLLYMVEIKIEIVEFFELE